MGLHGSAPEGSLQDQTSGGKASTQFPHTVVGAPINFAPEQIDRLRRGLHAYRVFSSVNGKRPSWRVVQKRIDALRADARIKHLTSDQTISFGSKERLRRFALNLTRLDEVDRLVDIKRLLLKAGVLTEGEISAPNDIRGEAITLNGYLANQSKLALFRIDGLSRSYRANSSSIDANIQFQFTKQSNLSWFMVEEYTYQVADATQQKPYFIQNCSRNGYGFYSTSACRLLVFLRGCNESDRAHYVGVEPGLMREREDFFLIRIGDDPGYIQDADPERRVVKNTNILHFRPDAGDDGLQASQQEGV